MKGTAHLAIGTVIGAGAAVMYPFTLKHAALYVVISAFSALSADLDGNSLLTGKLGKVSKVMHELLLWGGVLLIAGVGYLYFAYDTLYEELAIAAAAAFLLGLVAKEGAIRNGLVSVIGAALMYVGWSAQMNWLIGLGLFVAWAPWLKHRGMTHTVWALAAWWAIGRGLEQQLQLEGAAFVATVGYFSHLFADTLTPSGVKWLYPLYKKSFKLR